MKKKVAPDEQLVDLSLWFRNGSLMSHRGNGKNLPEVSVGRTDSERGMGFMVTNGKERTAFVLDREQVKNLSRFLSFQVPRLKGAPHQHQNFISLTACEATTNRARAARAGWRKRRANPRP